jgi:hypothetical protein
MKTLNATQTEISTLFNQIEEFSAQLEGNAELPSIVTLSLKYAVSFFLIFLGLFILYFFLYAKAFQKFKK